MRQQELVFPGGRRGDKRRCFLEEAADSIGSRRPRRGGMAGCVFEPVREKRMGCFLDLEVLL